MRMIITTCSSKCKQGHGQEHEQEDDKKEQEYQEHQEENSQMCKRTQIQPPNTRKRFRLQSREAASELIKLRVSLRWFWHIKIIKT